MTLQFYKNFLAFAKFSVDIPGPVVHQGAITSTFRSNIKTSSPSRCYVFHSVKTSNPSRCFVLHSVRTSNPSRCYVFHSVKTSNLSGCYVFHSVRTSNPSRSCVFQSVGSVIHPGIISSTQVTCSSLRSLIVENRMAKGR